MNKVKIVYKGLTYPVEIEDISARRMQERFNLSNPPEYLTEERAGVIIDSKYWKSELKAGSTYLIREQCDTLGNRNSDHEEIARRIGVNDSFRGIVLHSLIASTAVYHMKYNESDNTLVKKYLDEQIENHFFEYIIPSKYGENFYFIAKEKEANRIYIAFRGTKDLLDWNYNLQVIYRCYAYFFFLQISSKDKDFHPT